MTARDRLGAPPARGPAAAAVRVGGARPRPARALRARRRRPPGDRRVLARHGPPALRRARYPPRARRAAARRAVRRRRPDRRRGDPRGRSPTPAPAAPASWSRPTCASWPSRRAARCSCCAVARGRDASPPRRCRVRRGRVPTALSSTERSPRATTEPAWWRPVRDVGHLLRFRSAAVRRRSTYWWAVLLMVHDHRSAAAVIPAFAAADDERRLELGVLLPTGMAGILLISAVSAIASGGGRELVSREQGVAFPVSPTTDHLGALLLAPLNISWLIQAWVLLGVTSYVVGPALRAHRAAARCCCGWRSPPPLAQVIAWSVETVRRRRHGVVTMRAGARRRWPWRRCGCSASGRTTDVLDQHPHRATCCSGRSAASAGRGDRPCSPSSVSCSSPSWSARSRLTWPPAGCPTTSSGSRPTPAPRDRCPSPTSPHWCGSTARRCGARCRSDAAWRCSRSGPVSWSRCSATCRGSPSRSCRAWWSPAERCSSASTRGASTAAVCSGARTCPWRPAWSSTPARWCWPSSSASPRSSPSCWRRCGPASRPAPS